ncbi:dolichyl-diphosphooligosaccharide--protein glycosyltransferase subunit DAD1 [Capsicum annuum]|nr:dolichyl-diphosphooligosaccharide--protein glycosyltransferase subunit DAD1 [Capsicum annuum]
MENEGEKEKREANNLAVLFSALRKDVVNVLDFLEGLKNEGGQNAVNMANQIEELKLALAFICTTRLFNVSPQFQLMTERVGLFFWNSRTYGDSQLFKLAHLLMKIIPIELEVMHICFTSLKASPSAEVERFIKQILETSPDIIREYLIHLQEQMITVTTPSNSGARKIHVMIEFLLIVLTDMPKDFIHHDKLFDPMERIGTLIREVSTLVHDLEEKSRNEESTDETSRALDLLKNIELLKEDLKYVYLKAPDAFQWSFPMSDGPLFLHLLHKHLNDLQDSNAYSIALIKEDIELVKEALKFIRSCIVNLEEGLYKDLWARVLDVAYEAKDVIDSIIIRDNGLLHFVFSLPITIKKISLIKEDVSKLLEKIPKNKSLIVVNAPNNPVERKSLTTGKIIVGFKEETNWLISKLTRGPKDVDVISITGMPGSGKTTLAYKVYNDESVCSHLDIRAWFTVDQEYDEKKLLVYLFNQVTGSDLKSSEDIDVADKLRKQLYGKSPEESWELLEKRAIGEQIFPDELLEVGKENVHNCKGVPLVVDLIAGVIAGKENKKSVWLEVQNNLNSFILNSEVDVMKVIELSYDHLPLQLKPCFLYLSSYLKDTAVDRDVLKMYWRAEGLVEQTEMKSLEEVMEIYLAMSISSSLVIAFNKMGDLPSCQIHDLVHDFCCIKAKEETLFEKISSSDPSSSSSDLMPQMVNIDYNKEKFELSNVVLFSSKRKRHSGKHLYSLKITGHKMVDSLSDACHLRDLRPLRVLVMRDSFMMVKDSLLNEICMLNHLRFLAIETEVKSLPSSFSNLWNLETLFVDKKGSTLVLLPRIRDLVKLRVLSIDACYFFDLDTDESILIAEDSKLEKLRVFETLVLSYSEEIEDIFKRFPNLQRLRFNLKESWDYSTERYWFPKFDFLTELEHLTVDFKSSNSNDSEASVATNRSWDFHFPSNLKTLLLYDFPLASDSLSTIARLPNLEELFLRRTIIQGEEWNMREEDTFENLKYLNLTEVTLAKWEVGEESFPVIEKLVLRKCHMLEEIPPSFGEICSLKIIKLVKSPQLEDFAKKIKQYVEDMGGDELQSALEIISCCSFSDSCDTTDKNLIKNLMHEGSDRDEEPVAQNYSNVARSARIYQLPVLV